MIKWVYCTVAVHPFFAPQMLKITLSAVKIASKQRPRFSKNGHAYHSKNYRVKMADLVKRFKAINRKLGDRCLPLGYLRFVIHNRSAVMDGDNVVGFILDCLVNAEIISDDNVKVIPKFAVEYYISNGPSLVEIQFFSDSLEFAKRIIYEESLKDSFKAS